MRDTQTAGHKVLVVDDEPSICWALEKMLTQEGHDVEVASSAEEGLALATKHQPTLIFLDVRLPGEDGISALPKLLKASVGASIVVITAFGDLETAVAAVQNGASDYLTKPFRLEDALRTCRQAIDRSQSKADENATTASAATGSIMGQSPGMQQVFRQIALVADSNLSVLITGETGTGKELVAAAIHRHSQRADKPYIPIAPVTLNQDLMESELFGHAKGSFTGATEDRAGLFEQVQGGTVLLDEIGDLPLGTQVKLLRVLEQGQFFRVGDIQPRQAEFRVLAATNCDLQQAVRAGKFREDLFHRLSGVHIHLPPLRERSEDIPLLCRHFLQLMRYPNPEKCVNDDLLEFLMAQSWTGNVRELKSSIEHAAVVARGRVLQPDDFPPPNPARDDGGSSPNPQLDDAVRAWAKEAITDNESNLDPLHTRFLAATEPALLRVAMQHTGGNRAKAAELLGIHRGTLRERLRTYGIE